MINKLLVGKVDGNTEWLPLWVHLRDTAGIMELLVQNWVSDATIDSCDIQYKDFYRIAVFVAFTHDIGKATSYFQGMISEKVPLLYENIVGAGLRVHYNILHRGKTPHAFAGQWILQSKSLGINLDESIANVIGAHHGVPYSGKRINREEDLLAVYPSNFYGEENDEVQKKKWQTIWGEIVKEALDLSGYESAKKLPCLTVDAQVLLSGLLIVADWIASNTTLFPLLELYDDFSEGDFERRIVEGWEKLNFPEMWHSDICNMNHKIFQERFGFSPNDVQKEVIKVVNQTEVPGIFILEAQMGIGKTEAALSAAEVMASKSDSKGVFFGLPTQATCNGLYDRLYEWASAVSAETVNAIRLAHGGAVYNKEYQQQMTEGKVILNNDDSETNMYIHPWFQGNKKALLADFVIGTVDQFLMTSLRRRHFMLRHLGVAGKVIIIDECHAYDAYMNQYLDQSIEWMAGYGVPVVLLSATLPLKRRKELINRYLKGSKKNKRAVLKENKKESMQWMKNEAYPLITWSDGQSVRQTSIMQKIKNKTVKISYLKGIETTVDLLRKKLEADGCACVILNTIQHAQMYYKTIKANISDADVLLYHAQFTMDHRLEKEKLLLKKMGKNSSNTERKKFILIGTQVLEQSLDYDADILLTEICPMDLLLQRIGRLHRHNRCDSIHDYSRPKRLQEAECHIILEESSRSDKLQYDEGSKMVYGEYLLMRTLNIIPAYITIPKDIPQLVQRVYSEEDECGMECTTEYNQAKEEFVRKKETKKSNAKTFLLKHPRKTIRGLLDNENRGNDSSGELSVRDIESSIEVILMKQYSSNKIGFVFENEDKSQKFFSCNALTQDAGIEIARQRIRLPHLFGNCALLYRTIEELEERQIEVAEWQNNPWLQGELILLLDNDNSTHLCGYRLYYDFEVGLVVEKEENNG